MFLLADGLNVDETHMKDVDQKGRPFEWMETLF